MIRELYKYIYQYIQLYPETYGKFTLSGMYYIANPNCLIVIYFKNYIAQQHIQNLIYSTSYITCIHTVH